MHLKNPLNSKRGVTWALFGLTALFGVIYWNLYSESVPALHLHFLILSFEHVNAFSPEYFKFETHKPNGYPIFLFLIKLVTTDKEVLLKTAILIQLVTFLLSAWYLSIRFYCFSNQRSLSFLLLLLIIGNPEIVKFCFLIMTESFMISLLMLILGFNCQWASQKNLSEQQRTLILISSCMGAAILLRSICYAWIISVIFVLIIFYLQPIFTWSERFKTIKLFCIPLLLCWTLGASFHYLAFGTFKNQSILNEVMLGKVAIAIDPQHLESTTPFMKELLSPFKPVHKLMQQANTYQMKFLLGLIYIDGAIQPLQSSKHLYKEQDINKQTQATFIEMCINHPMQYLKNIVIHYLALWQFWDLMTPTDIRAFENFSKTYGPLPYAPLYYGTTKTSDIFPDGITHYRFSPKTLPLENLTPMAALRLHLNDYTTWPPFLFFIRTVMGIIWVMTLCFLGLGLLCLMDKQRSIAPIWAGLMGSSTLQATYLVTASINTSAFRYAIVMWPAVVFVGITFMLLFLKRYKCFSH